MSNIIHENQVEMVELSDEAMEAVAGGLTITFEEGSIASGARFDNLTIVFIENVRGNVEIESESEAAAE